MAPSPMRQVTGPYSRPTTLQTDLLWVYLSRLKGAASIIKPCYFNTKVCNAATQTL
nr:MAG TPA: hypothetical protein [Caudoviricetes sp.]